jgi:putative acetyltransferase
MIIRRESPADMAAARAVQVAAFGKPGVSDEPVEAALLDALRECDEWMPALSIVAEIDGIVVGHAVTTRGFVGDVPVVALGPIGVSPSLQHNGIGLALVHATIGAAEALDEPLIALLGSPAYYSRFGFVASSTFDIAPPDPTWGQYFQVRTLTAFRTDITGQFRYAAPFDEL